MKLSKDVFEVLLSRYQASLEESMEGREFAFDYVDKQTDFWEFYFIENNIKHRLYIDFPNWIKHKKAAINRKNNDNKCFKYAVTVALNR